MSLISTWIAKLLIGNNKNGRMKMKPTQVKVRGSCGRNTERPEHIRALSLDFARDGSRDGELVEPKEAVLGRECRNFREKYFNL